MTAIDITTHKDPARVLRQACEPNINPRGTIIVYHYGDYADNVHQTVAGRAAWDLHKEDKVILCQKMLDDEPRRYAYCAVLK